MNCKPGDLAVVVRYKYGVGYQIPKDLLGRVVHPAKAPARVIQGDFVWSLEEKIVSRLDVPLTSVSNGVRGEAGMLIEVTGLPDAVLQRIPPLDEPEEQEISAPVDNAPITA